MTATVCNEALLPRGYRAAGVAAGLKKGGRKDVALFVSDQPATVAGVFTTNQVPAASVRLCRARLAAGRARAVVMNSGNANACTGPQGARDAERMAALAGDLLGVPAGELFVCSTGHIGSPLPMNLVEAGIQDAVHCATADGGPAAAEAMMTTDTRPKCCAVKLEVEGRPVTLAGFAKGAGMIEPKMATMLAFLFTDAGVAAADLQPCLSAAVEKSFNRITVDGDRSTNDTVLFLANGAAGAPLDPRHTAWPAFTEAVDAVTHDLAMQIMRDGEGVTKVVTIRVTGAATDAEAEAAARAVANSLLVKTSWAGGSANWGRVMDALGYAPATVDPDRVAIDYDEVPAVRDGMAATASAAELGEVVGRSAFTLAIQLGLGEGTAVVYGCDCTEAYVRINL